MKSKWHPSVSKFYGSISVIISIFHDFFGLTPQTIPNSSPSGYMAPPRYMVRFAGDPNEIDAAKSRLKMLKKNNKNPRIFFWIVSIAMSINWGDYPCFFSQTQMSREKPMDIPFVHEIPSEMLPASCNLLGMGLYKGLTIWNHWKIPMVHHHVPQTNHLEAYTILRHTHIHSIHWWYPHCWFLNSLLSWSWDYTLW